MTALLSCGRLEVAAAFGSAFLCSVIGCRAVIARGTRHSYWARAITPFVSGSGSEASCKDRTQHSAAQHCVLWVVARVSGHLMHGSWAAERGAGWEVGTPVDVPALQLLAKGYACVAQESRADVTITPASDSDGADP